MTKHLLYLGKTVISNLSKIFESTLNTAMDLYVKIIPATFGGRTYHVEGGTRTGRSHSSVSSMKSWFPHSIFQSNNLLFYNIFMWFDILSDDLVIWGGRLSFLIGSWDLSEVSLNIYTGCPNEKYALDFTLFFGDGGAKITWTCQLCFSGTHILSPAYSTSWRGWFAPLEFQMGRRGKLQFILNIIQFCVYCYPVF